MHSQIQRKGRIPHQNRQPVTLVGSLINTSTITNTIAITITITIW